MVTGGGNESGSALWPESGAHYLLRGLGRTFGYALALFLLIAVSLAIFFDWTFPTNQATSNWTVVPKIPSPIFCGQGLRNARRVRSSA